MPPATEKNLRVFGIGLGVILTVFAFFSWRGDGPWFFKLAGFATAFALLGLFVPFTLKPVYAVWIRIAGVIALINTVLVLGFVYFVLITPYALFFRLRGRDPLDRCLGTDDSYWKVREPRPKEAYERLF